MEDWMCPNCGDKLCCGACMSPYNWGHAHEKLYDAHCVYCNYDEDDLILMYKCSVCPALGWGVRQSDGVRCLRCDRIEPPTPIDSTIVGASLL